MVSCLPPRNSNTSLVVVVGGGGSVGVSDDVGDSEGDCS